MRRKSKKALVLTTYYLLLMLLGSCSNDFDDSSIWNELNKQAGRLAKLEAWQTQVNNDITSLQGLVNALQNADAITATTSFSVPDPGGYDITFKSGTNIRIFNGAKGDPGNTPVIGVGEYPAGSGVHHWMLNGEWLLDNNGKKLPVTGSDGQAGQDGVAPQVRINPTTNYWEISTDSGHTWTSTGVNATGPAGGPQGPTGAQGSQGEKGDPGDAIFRENGVDYSHSDYVVFTLANGSTLTLPKYKEMGIAFVQPGTFALSETKEIPYTHRGESPTLIRAIDVPAGWTVVVDHNNKKLIVTAPGSKTTGVYEALILVSDGKERSAVQPLRLELWYDSNPLSLQLTVPAGSIAKLPIAGIINCTVDWGDGSDKQTVKTAFPFHTYAVAGTYTVTITGTVTDMRIYDGTNYHLDAAQRGYITSVLQWGNTGLTNMNRAFYKCNNLKSIASNTTNAFNRVINFANAFYDCTSLTSVPAYLFSNSTEVISFNEVFRGCTALVSIGENLFDNCTTATFFYYAFSDCTALASVGNNLFNNCRAATDFRYAFSGCTSLSSLPSTLFNGCTEVTSFENTFRNCIMLSSLPSTLFSSCSKVATFVSVFRSCTSLSLLPSTLFSNCTEVTSFNSAFYGCTSLMSIPASLFDNCKKVADFYYCFYNCRNLGGESPYTVVEGVKIHLWQRKPSNGFVEPSSSTISIPSCACFYNCTGLTDYASIPSSSSSHWK